MISNRYPGTWGVTDWYHDTIYISPSVPTGYLPSVVRHEWSHELSVRAYGGDVAGAVRAMNRGFGGPGATGIRGAEYAADCMAIQSAQRGRTTRPASRRAGAAPPRGFCAAGGLS